MTINYTVTTGTTELTGIGPTKMVIDPANIAQPDPLITLIEYRWSESILVPRRFLHPASPTASIIGAMFYPTGASVTLYTIQVWVTYADQITPILYNTINLHVYPAPLVNNLSNSGYAYHVHLLGNRSWELNDKNAYILELIKVPDGSSQPPNYVHVFVPST